ncbi:MAG: hypothetical protein FJ387_05175 [Verrucomicrobia bacterium]|nr:hypothetical protein [Verrucomicrobiota bacterium]
MQHDVTATDANRATKRRLRGKASPWARAASGSVLALLCAGAAYGQSADALIDKLVEKGILTVQEANELRVETDKDFTRAYWVKSGLPDWVTALKLSGDLRGRYEGFFSANPAFVDRNRFRYRMRLGVTAALTDRFEVGVRLTSGEADASFGGDPLSGNTSLGSNASKKYVFLDLAYARWTALNTPEWDVASSFGKVENPFVFPSTLMFDRDYTPEGFAQELTHRLNEKQSLRWAGGGFILTEVGDSSRDAYLLGTQLRLNSAWTDRLTTSVGAGWFGILSPDSLTNEAVPDRGRGNTRTAAGALVYHYNPFYLDAGATYQLESFPFYTGAFPITLSGDYLHNPAVRQDGQGYSVGVTLGKAGKKGLWDLTYRWTSLEADAWYEELPESDFGAFYEAAPVGGRPGYGLGTNVRGHWIKASYSPVNALTLSVACFVTELIHAFPPGSNSDMTRLQVDAAWRF